MAHLIIERTCRVRLPGVESHLRHIRQRTLFAYADPVVSNHFELHLTTVKTYMLSTGVLRIEPYLAHTTEHIVLLVY